MRIGRFYFITVLVGMVIGVYLVGVAPTVSEAAAKITFWHSLSGENLPAVEKIVKGFNTAHPDIEVQAQFMGSSLEVLAKVIAAVRAKKPPHIYAGSSIVPQIMIDSGAIVPIHELFKPGEVDFGDILWPVRANHSVKGKLYAMPFAVSTAILYYNKDLFKKAGLDPKKPPTTYEEIEEIGKKLINSGVVPSAFSTGFPDWSFETAHSYQNQFYTNNENGRKARATKVLFNGEFGAKYVETLARMAKEKVYVYGGKDYSANKAFLAQQIAMLVQSTSSVGSIENAAKGKFEVGTTFLPVLKGYPRGNSIVGGSASTIWAMKGHSKKDYEAIKVFLKWLFLPEINMQWHKDTGYYPVTNSASQKLLNEGWFSEHPNHLTAFLQILSGVEAPATIGIYMGPFYEVRKTVVNALEKALAGTASPKAALDEAVKESDRILQEYAAMYK